MHLSRLLALFLIPSFAINCARSAYEIVDFGASPMGNNDTYNALLQAWSSACSSETPAVIHIPEGRFFLSPVALNGPCKSLVTLDIDGTFVAPSSYAGSPSKWISFVEVVGLKINGGVFDGQGASLWDCKRSDRSCPHGSDTLAIERSRNVEIQGLSSVNSKLFHVTIHKSENVTVRGVKIFAPASSPNTDGIHVEMSRGVTITGSTIKTGDDCISIGPGSSNVWVESVTCGPGHGISIGSLGRFRKEEGVKNITVRTTQFTNTNNGVRIKAWPRASTGFVNGVLFQHAAMDNVSNPIIIDQHYCPSGHDCHKKASGVKISQVQFWNINGTSATKIAVKLDCSSSNPCSGISLRDIELTYQGKPAESRCRHATGTIMGVVDPPGCF